jgi:hypothetical protein
MDATSFLQGRTRETTIRRDAQGQWFHDGQPLEHPGLCRSFDRWVQRAEDGRWCLKNDINWAYITLEGAPFFVRGLRIEDDGVVLRLSDDSEQPLDADSLRQGPDGALYCDVRGGEYAARFERHVAAQLEPLIGEDDEGVFVKLQGRKVRPEVLGDPVPTRAERESKP